MGETHRGEGVGSALLDAIEDRARACGSTRLSLDVSAGNEGAHRLYERRGLAVESDVANSLFSAAIHRSDGEVALRP